MKAKSTLFFIVMFSVVLFSLHAFGEGNYTANGNGTVTDNETGLMWQQSPTGGVMHWTDALAHCENLEIDDLTDWRLPNIKELQTLVDHSRIDPSIDINFFQMGSSSYFWSSTTRTDPEYAWGVSFHDGSVGAYIDRKAYYTNAVRCVRGGL